MTTGKTIALTWQTFVGKVMSLLFNMLSAATATAKSHQMYPTLCDRIDSNPPPMSDSATSWTAAYQAPLSIGFSRQEYWSGVSLTSLNMLSRLVITFLPRSKRLLISWLQSPSAVTLEPRKIKSDTVSTVSASISHEAMGPDAMIFVFWMLRFKPTFHSSLSLSSRGFLVPLHFLP